MSKPCFSHSGFSKRFSSKLQFNSNYFPLKKLVSPFFDKMVWLLMVLGVLTSSYALTISYELMPRDPSKEICADYRLYYNQTGKCYYPYRQGPCGKLMVLTESNENFQIGECNCKTFPGDTRPTVHWPETSRCYFLFDQGPCKTGEWLVVSEGSPKCDPIPCPDLYVTQPSQDDSNGILAADPKFLFSYQGKCYFTLTQGFCTVGKITVFAADSIAPKCITEAERVYIAHGVSVGSDNKCPDNQEQDATGGCEPNTNI